MADLIDRYATMDAIPAPTDADEAEYYGKVCDVIEAMPTIKSDVRRGRWKLGSKADNACVIPSDLEFYCTFCGKEAIHDYDDTQVLSDFCPHCGADMREKGTDNG